MTFSNRFRLGALALILLLGLAPLSGWSQVTVLYGWSATNVRGQIEMDGSLPTEQLQRFLGVRAGGIAEDTTRVKDGAPEHFSQDAIAGITVLRHFERGRVAFTGAGWSLTGILLPSSTVDNVLGELSSLTDSSNWDIDISDSPMGPPAPQQADGSVEVAPMAAAAPAEGATLDESQLPPLDLDVAPPLFEQAISASELPVLNLDAGLPNFEAAGAAVPEVIETAEEPESVSNSAPESQAAAPSDEPQPGTLLTDDQLPPLDLNVGLPLIEQVEPDSAAPTPVLDAPYTWSVAKNGDAISFEGDVPTDGLRRYLLVRAGEGAGDGMDVRPDAPDGFVDQVLAGMDPLLQSDEARISFRDGKWVFTGLADDQESLDALSRQLEANAHTRDWTRILSVRPVTLSAMKANGGPVELNGLLPAASLRSYLQVISGNGNVDNVRIGGQAAPDFVNAAIAGVRALNNLETGELSFNGAHWNLTGQSLTNLDAESAKSLVAALPAGKSWTIDIRQAPLFDICSRAVTAFSDSHQILFAPASARIESESRSQLGDLADELLKCPDADLYVEGHTDSDGPADANMALSVARAEAVIEELIGLGISYTRLYAIGYGETLPIASNETRQGKAQNRRIVFELIKQQ